MTDQAPGTDDMLFGVRRTVWAGWIRHGLTLAAGSAASWGVALPHRFSIEALDLGTAIGVTLVVFAWSAVQKRAKT